MIDPPRLTPSTLARLVVALAALGPAGSDAPADPPRLAARWVGQDGHDFVGGEPGPAKNDFQDVRITIKGVPPALAIAEVVVIGQGHGQWNSQARDRFAVHVVRAPKTTAADLYFEPYQREVGREFEVHVKFVDKTESVAYLAGGKADPNLRAPGQGVEAKWLGPDGQDRTGPGPGVGPDGSEDVHVALSRLSAKAELKAVEVAGPDGLVWASGMNPKGHPGAEAVRKPDDPTRADVYFSPGRDLDRQALKVTVTYGDGRTDVAKLVAGKSGPAKAAAKAAAPGLVAGPATARWLGQDGVGTAPGDVHVAVDGLPAGRPIVAAALSDGVVGTWVFRPGDKAKIDAGAYFDRLNVRPSGPSRLDLAFPPARDEAGATMTLRLVDASGREELVRFPGGAADPEARAPALPPGVVTARPGDDLNDLAGRFGTVHLSTGTHELARPLILHRPTRLVGEAGATIRFAQPGDQPPWTAAIKIHAGGTTLEGFAVRFAGPVRWDRAVSYGPALIGTTDDRDKGNDDPRHKIIIRRLDLQAPPSSTDGEEAPRLLRLNKAASGRIEANRLKGGAILFAGGPWTITDNDYRGPAPRTFSYGLFNGLYTHDLTLARNRARDEAPSGKTWRFLVLAQRGAFDVVRDNDIGGGIGPREDDARQHDNAPEVILTEAYRLHFEGRPASISADGRVVAIPAPQGEPAGTGDVLAILSGPEAGQWRTIAQPLGPRAYLLDAPIARETDAVSIATGFVRETFEGNTVDCRGSRIAANFVLAGNHYGVRVVRNRFLGGGETIRLHASPTEQPVHWGWSHAPFLGGLFEGNTVEDAGGGSLDVEHNDAIKSNRGRVYQTLTFKDNTFRWTGAAREALAGKPPRFGIGSPASLDPGELVVTEAGTRIEGAPPGAVHVHAATVNGKAIRDAPLPPRR